MKLLIVHHIVLRLASVFARGSVVACLVLPLGAFLPVSGVMEHIGNESCESPEVCCRAAASTVIVRYLSRHARRVACPVCSRFATSRHGLSGSRCFDSRPSRTTTEFNGLGVPLLC